MLSGTHKIKNVVSLNNLANVNVSAQGFRNILYYKYSLCMYIKTCLHKQHICIHRLHVLKESTNP